MFLVGLAVHQTKVDGHVRLRTEGAVAARVQSESGKSFYSVPWANEELKGNINQYNIYNIYII